MYCPKCKEIFDEGSRRFCPTDGARLVSEAGGESRGIFANLIPKIDAISDLDETLSDMPRFTVYESASGLTEAEVKPNPISELIFELKEQSSEPLLKSAPQKPMEPVSAEPKPGTRKVKPFEIPAGHVDLGDAARSQSFTVEFDEDKPESFVGKIVKGRYKVTEFLGGDESGLVYLADDKIVEGKLVLVRILLEDEYDEIMRSIIAEERISLSHFSHPNIARLIDSGQFANGTNFLISEFVDALSVSDILGIHGPFSELRTARIIRQTADALNEAHQEGILHRDLRPENLIIDTSAGDIDHTTLVNFGASNGEPTKQNLAYKAPEVLDGRISTISSDIYSLATIAYQMLTGRVPFSGSTAEEIFRSQYAGMEEAPTSVRPELPRAVDDVLDRAMSFTTSDRYPKARDFGDALFAALTESPKPAAVRSDLPAPPIVPAITLAPVSDSLSAAGAERKEVRPVKSAAASAAAAAAASPSPSINEPAWRNRSPEPPEIGVSRTKTFVSVGLLALVALLAAGWYFYVFVPTQPQTDQLVSTNNTELPIAANTEMPPLPRNVPQPPNTSSYQNSKQNLRGDLVRNFVGFTIYYPKDWKVNGPREGASPNVRGKFLDISRSTPDGRLKEQMLISYYPSKGTFAGDADRFPRMVNEANETLKKLLPGYQMVSEGEIKINGDWRAYEIKFQGGGTSDSGEKLVVWGRRLFIPAARPGARSGIEITMLATSLADEVRSVDDIGVRGELAAILYSFEPGQNF